MDSKTITINADVPVNIYGQDRADYAAATLRKEADRLRNLRLIGTMASDRNRQTIATLEALADAMEAQQ